MLRKICPICEQTMKLSHYCTNCRQWVKTPYIRDVTYYLNESHPEGEKNCEYHGVYEEKRRTVSGTARPSPSVPAYLALERKRRAGANPDAVKVACGVVAAMILIQVIGAARNLIGNFYIPANHAEGEEFQLLSDQEVQDAGIACVSNGHYSISGSFMVGEMERIIGEAGYDVDHVETSSWNYAEVGEGTPWTDYETTVEYYVSLPGGTDENTLADSVMVNYDTATGELHGVNFYVSEPDVGAFMAGEILDFLQIQEEIPANEDYGALVAGEILKYSDRGEDGDESGEWREIPKEGEGGTEVYFHETDGAFYVRIWKTWD